MKSGDVYPGRFLKAEDLTESDLTLTIKECKMEKFEQTGDEKPALYFTEMDKGLIVNKTNWKRLVEETGEEDSDNWPGKKVTLTIVEAEFKGDVVSAIRIKKTKK
jgi:hypothetical protein